MPPPPASRLQHGSHDDDGSEGAGKDCGEAVNGKGRRYTQASASDTMTAASLTDLAERGIAFGVGTPVTLTGSVTAGISSVTAGVTDVVTMIASA
jgi:hypothetical protein